METPVLSSPLRPMMRDICLDIADCIFTGRAPIPQYVWQFLLMADGMSVIHDILSKQFGKIIFDTHETLPDRYIFNCRVMTIRTYRANDTLGFLDLWTSSFSWAVVTQLLNDGAIDDRQTHEADKVIRVIFSTAWNMYGSPRALNHYILDTKVLALCVKWLVRNNHRFPTHMRDIMSQYVEMTYSPNPSHLGSYNEIILRAMIIPLIGKPNE